MADPWEVEINGQVYEVQANTPEQAATLARLYAAREQGTAQATAGAIERSKPTGGGESYPRLPLGVELDPSTPEGKINNALMLASGAGPLVSSAIAAPGATAASLAGGYVGSEVGQRGGQKLEQFGAPSGTSKVLGLVGGLGGGIYGGLKGQEALTGLLKSGVGRGSAVGQILEKIAGAGAAPVAGAVAETTEEATKRAALALEKQQAEIAAIRANADKVQAEAARVAARQAQDAERHELQKQILQRRLEGKAPLNTSRQKAPKQSQPSTTPPAQRSPAAAEPEVLPDDAVSIVAEPVPPRITAPYDQRATPENVAQIAEQIQQKSGILQPGVTPDGRKIVAEELAKLPAATREQVEAILARGQAHPATIYQPAPGMPKPTRYNPSSKPLDDPLMEFARQEGIKPGRTWGDKIYLELDSAGKPVRVLNGPQAATALERRGVKTTWVKNLWGERHDAKSARFANAD